MRKYKVLVKNISVISISQFGSKLLAFLLVPLYTSCLSTEEYGVFDAVVAVVSLCIPVLMLNIYSSTQRFAMDENAELGSILTYSFRGVLFASAGFLVVLGINWAFEISLLLKENALFALGLFFLECLVNVLSCFAIGINKVTLASIAGAVSTVTMLTANIVLLAGLHLGLYGFYLANISGPLVQSIILLIALDIKIDIRKKNQPLLKEMLAFSVPLIATNIAWWVNSVSDRFVIIWFKGVAVNGIYSIAYKIPGILNVFQTVFSQAWVITAVRDYDSEDRDGFFSNVYSYYNSGMILVCSLLIMFTRIIAKVMYSNDFYAAWEYVPFLLISVLFGALSGFFGGVFSAIKNSKVTAYSTVVGAICNLILNIVLIQFWGAFGAAVSTAVSYLLVWVIRIAFSMKIIKLKIHFFIDVVAYIILVVQALGLVFIDSSTYVYMLQAGSFIAITVIYRENVGKLLRKLLNIQRTKQ